MTPDLIIVPLLAFDAAGGRLGQGGGYYDRTLEALRAVDSIPPIAAVGLAYAGQEMDNLPMKPHDQPLDGVLTEAGYRSAKRTSECDWLSSATWSGKSGRDGLADHLPGLRRDLELDFVVVNAENAAGGFGITENTARELFAAGADCLTLGNHSWDQREALTYIVREPRLIRPANYPRLMDAPGRARTCSTTSAAAGCWS